MKRRIKIWAFRLMITVLFIVSLLLIIVLNPILTYANKTTLGNYTVFHNKPFNAMLGSRVNEAKALIQKSEFYNPRLSLDICLNEGFYPALIQKVGGQAFARGFYNKVVLQGEINYSGNTLALNGYKWNLVQLLAHEMVHCMQYDKLGFWKSNPIARIPAWKWEGYAEYISRQGTGQIDLIKNIALLSEADRKDANSWEIVFSDNTIAPREYYNYWLLVQYCLDIKKMTCLQLLNATTDKKDIQAEMMSWFAKQK